MALPWAERLLPFQGEGDGKGDGKVAHGAAMGSNGNATGQ